MALPSLGYKATLESVYRHRKDKTLVDYGYAVAHLYSSAFSLMRLDADGNQIPDTDSTTIPSRFILDGRGWGHGVGLCQIGAAVMGEQGFKYNDILLHYYQNAEIKKAY